MPDTKHVVIVGGGISGLATAYALQEEARKAGLSLSYTLLEKDNRLGGKIVTERADGFVIEGGPDCFISQKPWAADLCRRLGIGDELMGTNDERRKTYVVNHQRLAPLPDGVMLIIPTRIMPFVTSTLISWPGKLRMGMDLVLPRRRDDADESIADFVRRRLGNEALNKIAEPLLSGIHVSDPEMQSLLGTFPRFRALEVNHRSLILGMLAGKRQGARGHMTAAKNGTGAAADPARRNGHAQAGGNNGAHASAGTTRPARKPSSLFISLRGGLSRMVETLEGVLTGQVLKGVQATEIVRTPGGQYEVWIDSGATLSADAVVLASPAYVSAELIAQLAPELSGALGAIRYVSTATISLGYRADEAGHLLKGFGYVVPRQEQRQVSACTWTSTKFDHRAPEGMALVRCFVGGPGHEELVDLTDDELVALARREMGEIMGLQAEPVVTRIFRWRRANPQYDVGHLDRMAHVKEMLAGQPGLFITGSAYEGVGIPDCVRQGEQAAAATMAYLKASVAQATVEVPAAGEI